MPGEQAIHRFTYSRNGEGYVDERCTLRVTINRAVKNAKHTVYQIDVVNVQTRQTWSVSHRFSEFLKLRDDLLAFFSKAERKCPGCKNYEKVIRLFDFPRKHYFTSDNPMVITARKKSLQAFGALLASHTFTTAPKCPTCSDFPFTAVRDFLTEEVAVPDAGSPEGSAVTRDTIRESIKVKDFTASVPVAKLKAVNSEGVFIREDSKTRNKAPSVGESISSLRSSRRKEVPMSPVSSTASESSHPASPAAAANTPVPTSEDVSEDKEGERSYVSFSGPPRPLASGEAAMESKGPGKKRQSSKRRRQRKLSSHQALQTEPSYKDSVDEEFGSLNLDFLSTASVKIE
ncbi:hypothetical protein P43SY_007183 [Pythium insidiosum]|uniref:PX domain-containing protein n=1 Tax=Pythium insidiosum TaxID=114742 RepID=A0AAD5LIY6_PYTIN|nr:hypothetical protein P43SY_007183 [Pythium insidiosum]